MIFDRYKYPLPNNGSGYSFSERELVELLDSIYEKGFNDGVASATISKTIVAYTDIKKKKRKYKR